jgi:NADH-quinone oxidoreductase subunit C
MDPAAAPTVALHQGGSALDINDIYQKLLRHFGAEVILALTPAAEGIRDPFIVVKASRVDKVGLYCRVESDLRFDFCQSLTALDTGETLTCVYHLYSYVHRHTVVIKTAVPRGAAQLPSCVAVWPAADWYEREAYDLFGLVFDGHPDLRRLLLPEDWPGHPMRKDWQEPAFYNGIPTTRDNPLDLLEEDAK